MNTVTVTTGRRSFTIIAGDAVIVEVRQHPGRELIETRRFGTGRANPLSDAEDFVLDRVAEALTVALDAPVGAR